MRIGHIFILAIVTVALLSCRGVARAGDAGSDVTAGRTLFLKNCAHCHGADARGDEGPDLHKLEVSDEWIGSRIRNGNAGEMTAFAGKLQPAEINSLIAYLRTLK